MNSMKIICKLNMKVSRRLSKFVGIWPIFFGVVICLTAFPIWAAEPPDSEKKDDEVVTQVEENPETQVKPTESNKTEKKSDNNDTSTEPTKEVITGTADEMERYEKTGITILIGNAKTKRHNEQGVEIGFLNADKITLKANPETGETTEIVAEGNVEIRDQEIFATCDHATMNNLTNIIVLKDNVVVLQKKDRLETKLFTFNRTTGKQTGVGDVKFSVTVTQATPTAEESEEGSSDSKDTSATPSNTDENADSPETEKETEKGPNADSGKADIEEKTTPPETEKGEKDAESKSEKETEPAESEETEPAESEETEPTESEEEADEAEKPKEEQ